MKILLLSLVLAAVAGAPQENKGILEGKVTRPNSSEGIAEVQITLQGPSPLAPVALSALYTPNPALTPAMRADVEQPAQPRRIGVVTDNEGRFSFKGLAPGRYSLRAQRAGYFGVPPPGAFGSGSSTVVTSTATVLPGEPISQANIEMLRGATVSGRVHDPNGRATAGLEVNAFQAMYQNGRATLVSVKSTTADDRGEYRLFWLAPGDYYIAVIPRRPLSTPGPQDTYSRTFHPGVTDGRTASLVTVAEGAVAAGVDINVRGDATGRISGKVISAYVLANGQPSSASTFYLEPIERNALSLLGSQSFPNMSANRTDGQFEIRGVAPGAYDLLTSVQDGGTPSRQVWGRTRVTVGGGNLENVFIAIKPGVEVRARLTVDGEAPPYTMQSPTQFRPTGPAAAPVPTPSIRLTLRPTEVNFGVNASNQNAVFDPSGVFVFPNVPEGKYTVEASVPANSYIAAVRAGGDSALTNAFDEGFDVASLTQPIEVIVKSNGVRIQGVVRDAEQKPFASAMVVLVPPQTRRENPLLYKTASSDASGNFTLNGVAPGEYRIFAWESVPEGAWMNPEFIARNESRGQSVTAALGNAGGGDVRVIPKTLR